jgi:hypothetical protein
MNRPMPDICFRKQIRISESLSARVGGHDGQFVA